MMRNVFRTLVGGGTLVPNFQNRVLLGLSFFAGIVLLVGWVAINEPARMQVFTQQHQGRSIEAGAAIFLNTCSTCHGVDGKGIKGVAPALNNPMLFLKSNPAKDAKDKLDALVKQQTDLGQQIKDYNQNVQDLAAAQTKLAASGLSDADKKTLQDQITSLNAKIKGFDVAATQTQIDDLNPKVDQATADLKKLQDQGWDETRDVRLTEVKWGGSLHDYIASTVTSGRPISGLYWPRAMPNWGQVSGGPLRDDEIQDVTAYILNFENVAVKLTPNDLNEQLKSPTALPTVKLCQVPTAGQGTPAPTGPAATPPAPVTDKFDVGQADAAGALGQTDAKGVFTIQPGMSADDLKAHEDRGADIYSALGCAGCHTGVVGPNVEGTWTRVLNIRTKLDQYLGKSPEFYIASSIVRPSEYIVPSFSNVMPPTFGSQLCVDDIRDIIAYLSTKK